MTGERTGILERYRRKNQSIAKDRDIGENDKHQTNVAQTDDKQKTISRICFAYRLTKMTY